MIMSTKFLFNEDKNQSMDVTMHSYTMYAVENRSMKLKINNVNHCACNK